jgi:hypothetical protein
MVDASLESWTCCLLAGSGLSAKQLLRKETTSFGSSCYVMFNKNSSKLQPQVLIRDNMLVGLLNK